MLQRPAATCGTPAQVWAAPARPRGQLGMECRCSMTQSRDRLDWCHEECRAMKAVMATGSGETPRRKGGRHLHTPASRRLKVFMVWLCREPRHGNHCPNTGRDKGRIKPRMSTSLTSYSLM